MESVDLGMGEKKAQTEGFLLQDEEDRVNELEVLEIVVDNVIEF